MKRKNLASIAMMAIATLSLVACQEKTPEPTPSPTPGSDDDPTTVYFSVKNGDYCFYVGADDTKEADIIVERENNESAVEYAIKTNDASDGVEIPEKIAFAAGESTAVLAITIPSDATVGDSFDFDISLTGDNVNSSFSNVDLGTLRCEGSIYLYQEVTFRGRLGTTDSGEFKYFGNWRQAGWKIDDNTIILKGFLGGNSDLTVRLGDAEDWNKTDGSLGGQKREVTNFSYNQYDLYQSTDDYGGQIYWFWSDPDGDDKGDYEYFYPKGDQRYIYALALYIDTGYSVYYTYADSEREMLRFETYEVDVWGEDEGIDEQMYWKYMYFDILPESDMSAIDFDTLPVVEVAEYPKAVEKTTDAADSVVLGFKIGKAQLDDQVAAKVENADGSVSYTVDNLWWSDAAVTFTQKDGVFSVSEANSYSDGSYYYFLDKDGYYLWFWPWDNDYDQGIYGLCYYDSESYCTFDNESMTGSFYAYWNFWEGADYTVGDDQEGNLVITVK